MNYLPAIALTLLLSGTLSSQAAKLQQGPLLGHADTDTARVWARGDVAGKYVLTAHDTANPAPKFTATATASPEHDHCLVFDLQGLTADHRYAYRIEAPNGTQLCGGDDFVLRTAPDPTADGTVRLMFASCCREDEGSGKTWKRVQVEQPDLVVLLGDTPYIDNTQLAHQRKRYAEFATFPPMANLLRTTPWYGT